VKDIVLIPTYVRPEYLQLCLFYLGQAKSTDSQKEFWICADRRPDDEYRFRMLLEWQQGVFNAWKGILPELRYIQGEKHSYLGNSFNVLESYKKAYNESSVRYIYLVEDDVLVTPDFFKWHEALQEAEPATICSIAYRCSRNHEARTDVSDPAAYFTTARDYASIGVCWRRENLGPIVEHARKEYYSDLDGYIGRTFPGNRFATDFCEQDGMIMRCLWNVRGFTSWPYVPRAYHMGWFGYHRPNGKRPDGFLAQKVDTLRSWISDAERLKIVAPDYGDIEPYPTQPMPPYGKLEKLQHFE
jgi:hypothetical protein